MRSAVLVAALALVVAGCAPRPTAAPEPTPVVRAAPEPAVIKDAVRTQRNAAAYAESHELDSASLLRMLDRSLEMQQAVREARRHRTSTSLARVRRAVSALQQELRR